MKLQTFKTLQVLVIVFFSVSARELGTNKMKIKQSDVFELKHWDWAKLFLLVFGQTNRPNGLICQ